MIQATIRMVIAPHNRRQVVEILTSSAERTRIREGCLCCRIYHDEQQEGVFMVEEVWKCQDDLDYHLLSDDYRRVLLVTEMALEPPEIQFKTISHSAGIELIERARGLNKNSHREQTSTRSIRSPGST
jgi:quinol monooxygenase YgiN